MHPEDFVAIESVLLFALTVLKARAACRACYFFVLLSSTCTPGWQAL